MSELFLSSNNSFRSEFSVEIGWHRYNLGPNGGILTSLNLFATKIDQIVGLLEKRTSPDPLNPSRKPAKKVLVDTPGQIEVFVWSASGSILLDSLASSLPTVIAYIIDTPRTSSTSTFMSNMLYACSILYKTKLPMILVFNKTDVQDAAFAKEWMTDFEAFQAALRQEEQTGSFGGLEGEQGALGGGSGYMGSLLNSMSLVLEEFYRHLSVVGVSSMTGHGIDEFFQAVNEKVDEFNRDYQPELERRRKERDSSKAETKNKELGQLMRDLHVSKPGSSSTGPQRSRPAKEDPETVSEAEDEPDEHDIPAELVEPDDEGIDEEETSDEEISTARNGKANRPGLSSSYGQALRVGSGHGQPTLNDDHGFTSYLQSGGRPD